MACMFPVTIKNPAPNFGGKDYYTHIPVPCGKCPNCLQRRSQQWIFRLLEHDKVHIGSLFITLTYDNEHVPISKNGYMTLCKKDFQLFMKRLRKSYPKTHGKISYYACGEYGETYERPHFHAIVFNAHTDNIQRAWQLGQCHFGQVSGDSIAYTTKYMHKGKIIPKHQNDDRVPEFQLFSQRLGISYLSPATIKYHQDDITRLYVTFPGGQKAALPRYFRDKIYSDLQRKIQADLAQHMVSQLKDKKMYEFARDNPRDNFYRAEAEAKKAALNIFKRRLSEKRNKNF